ncbi:MAG: right-handed parallel beta-helix repeat-containing protein [Elusimicrobiota bacterium]
MLSLSTVTSVGGNSWDAALSLYAASSNTFASDYIANAGNGGGMNLFAGSDWNTVLLSTISFDAYYANGDLYLSSSSYNSFNTSAFYGVWLTVFDSSSDWNTIGASTLNALGAGAFGFTSYNGTTGNKLYQSAVFAPGAGSYGADIENAVGASVVASTIQIGADGIGIYLDDNLGFALSNSAVLASTPVFIDGSTNSVIGGSLLAVNGPGGAGLYMHAADSQNILVTSNVITGGSLGEGIFVDQGNDGLLNFSTNTISGAQYGVYIATQNSTAQIFIASNTISVSTSPTNNTYGVFLDGLTTGATIENNSIVYRTSGSMGANASYALYTLSSTGLLIDHNRINEPGMVTGGSFIGVDFVGTTNSSFKFNDVNSTGTGFANAYLLEATNGSTNLIVKDNVFVSSFGFQTNGSSATMVVDATSNGTPANFNYNDYFSSNSALSFVWGAAGVQGLAAWKTAAAGLDANSLSANPYWYNAGAGVEDFHPMSQAGRCNNYGNDYAFTVSPPCTYSQDAIQSPTIDAGDPSEAYNLEPAANGNHIVNLGSTGDTNEASESNISSNFCAAAKTVCASGCSATTIGGALALIPSPLTGFACVVIEDSRTYNEQVSVRNFTMSGSSLTIMTDPAVGAHAVVAPNVTSDTAAFIIANSSVNLFNLDVRPSSAVAYGVQISSAYVSLSSVNVQDSAGKISAAAVLTSSWTTVTYTSVTVGALNASGFWLPGSTMTSISYSSAVANANTGAGAAALRLTGAWSNAFTVFLASNPAGNAAALVNSGLNSISFSTLTTQNAFAYALSVQGASSNTITQTYMSAPVGSGALLSNSNFNSIAQSTMAGGGGGYALSLSFASSNTITQSYMANAIVNGAGADLSHSNYNTISQSTMTGGANGTALHLGSSSSNTITGSYIADSGANGGGANVFNSNYNTISLSTMMGGAGSFALVVNASFNTFSQSYIVSALGYGVYLNASNANAIIQSTMTINNASYDALYLAASSSNTITQSAVYSPLGSGAFVDGSSNYNSFGQTIMTGGNGQNALYIGGSFNTVTQGFITNALGSGAVLNAANSNTINQSTMTGGGAGNFGLATYGSSSNTFSGDYVQGSTAMYVSGSTGTVVGGSVLVATNTSGSALQMDSGSANMTVSSSVLTAGPSGAAVYLGAGNGGLISLATNTLSGAQYGVYVATQAAGTHIWIASNTVIPSLSSLQSTYGLYLNGLQTGATIQNNGVYYRSSTAGPTGTNAAYALFAQSSKGLNIDHNRFNNPGMIVSGNFTGAYFTGATATAFKFNDVNSTGTGLGTAYLMQLVGSTLTIRDNIFLSSVSAASSATLTADAVSGFNSDYNDFFSSNSLNTLVWGAKSYQFPWSGAIGQDADSMAQNPLWFNAAAGVEDFHPESSVGRCSSYGNNYAFIVSLPCTYAQDVLQSPTIDAGDPAEAYNLEPILNGNHLVNQGSTGDTNEASESIFFTNICAAAKTVCASGCSATTIGGALALIPSPLTEYACVVIEDSRTYNEQVDVRNFTMNGSSLTIMTDPAVGAHAVVAPNVATDTAAFVIADSSVNLFNLDVRPAASVTYGVMISSTYVQLSSVNVQDAGGHIAAAGVMTSSWTTVSYTSVMVAGANTAGFWLPGSTMTTVSYSSATSAGATNSASDGSTSSTGYAMWLVGASSNTISYGSFANTAGDAVRLEAGSNGNTVAQSTVSAANGNGYDAALMLVAASSNTFTLDYMGGDGASCGGMSLFSGSNGNAISFSTIAYDSIVSGNPDLSDLYLIGSSSNNFFASQFSGRWLTELDAGSNWNTISASTYNAIGSGAYGYMSYNGNIGNTLSQSYVYALGPDSYGADVEEATGASIIATTFQVGLRGRGVYLYEDLGFGLSNSSVLASTPMYVDGSTNSVIGGSILTVNDPGGIGIYVSPINSQNIVVTSNVITGGSLGQGVFVDQANSGSLNFSTNTISGAQYGMYVATQNPTAQIYITSNTLWVSTSSTNNTYGLFIDGLASGATVENNAIVYRGAGSMGAFASYALYAQSASGLLIDHNRVDEPGMIAGGSFIAVDFVATTNSAFKFNDVNSTGAFTNAFLLEATDVSTGLVVKDNVFGSSFAVSGASATVIVDATSNGTPANFNYNDYFSSNSVLGFVWGAAGEQGLAAWKGAAVGLDANSISANPLWYNPSAGVEDFHPMSQTLNGRYVPGSGFTSGLDPATSPTIDAGDPAEPFGSELPPNGGVVNQGSYGDTAQASKSVTLPNYPGCVLTNRVGTGELYATITSAVQAIPAVPPLGKTCVLIEDGATYAEQVTVANFSMSASSIAIFGDPSKPTPTVSPLATSTAAFVITNASVSVMGINVVPTHAMTYGVFISSAYVQLSSVNVLDAGGRISAAGIVASSWTMVSYTSVTVSGANATGVWLAGSTMTSLAHSSATVNGASAAALILNGASSNTVSGFFAINGAGTAAILHGASNNNTISLSTMTGAGAASSGLFIDGSVLNTIMQSYAADASSFGVVLTNLSNNNTIANSTITSGGTDADALYMYDSSSNTITTSYVAGAAGYAAVLSTGSNYNTISQTTMTTTSGTDAVLLMISASSNTFSLDYLSAVTGDGADLYSSDGNTISFSTIVAYGPFGGALYLTSSSWNNVFGSALYSTGINDSAVWFDSDNSWNTIAASTISASQTVYGVVFMGDAGISIGNALSDSFVSGPAPDSAGVVIFNSSNSTISGTTIQTGGAQSLGLVLTGDYGTTLLNSTVLGSTAVLIGEYAPDAWYLPGGSTATTIGGSMLLSSDPGGAGLYMDTSNNLGLAVSSSVIVGGALGQGIFVDQGNFGQFNFSTNSISGAQYGVYIATQAGGAQVFLTSNTIMTGVSGANNTYGLYLNGLMTGATIENNSIVYRSAGSMAANASYAFYAQSSSGLLIDHNRVDEPGMITGGSFIAVGFSDTPNSAFKFNDVNSTGTGFTNAYLLEAMNASTGLVVKDNIFFSSFSVSGASATVAVDAASIAGFSADYNDYYSSNSLLGFRWGAAGAQGLAAWRTASSGDAHSMAVNPLWFNVSAGVEDFHPLSTTGRWNQALQNMSNVDAAESSTIDAADPLEVFAGEPVPNGFRSNLGSYGGTAQASESRVIGNCAVIESVGAGQSYATISAAVAAVPSPLPGNACVIIEDGATYPEQVTLQNIATNGWSLEVFGDPAKPTPSVSPPANSTAAFVIANASASVTGINIVPTHAMTYGVLISSAYVRLSSVNVQDAAGKISAAGIEASSWTTVSYTSVTVGGANAAGFWLPGSVGTIVSNSSAAVNSATGYAALWLNGASFNTITLGFWTNPSGYAVVLDTNSNGNAISQATMTSGGAGYSALDLIAASSNTITQSSISGPAGTGVYLSSGSSYNTISNSTMTSDSANEALYVGGAFNAVTQSYIANPAGFGAYLDASSNFTTISLSSIASGGADAALTLNASSSNTFSSDYIGAAGADGADLLAGSGNNSLMFSTIASAGVDAALYLSASSSNTLYGIAAFATGPAESGVWFDAGSGANTVGASVVSASADSAIAFELDGNSGNTLSQSFVFAAGAHAIGVGLGRAGNGADGTLISGTTIQAGGGLGDAGLFLTDSNGVAIVNCSILGSTAVYISSAAGTTIGGSILTASDPAGAALYVDRASSMGLAVTSNVMVGGALGQGVFVDQGNSGLLNFSTNTISGAQYGVYIAIQLPGTQVGFTSNTIVASVSPTNNTYGLYLNGLATGATIENNAIVYRAAGTMGVGTSFAFYAQSASGLLIDHNRVDEPGMITGGSYVAVEFSATTNSSFKFNDVNSTGTGFTNAYLLEATNASTGLIVKDNIFLSSFVVTGGSAMVYVDAASEPSFAADYNDYFSSNSLPAFQWGGSAVGGLAAWRAASGGDAHSSWTNPLWFNAAAGAEDFHPQSVAGRWTPAGFVMDAAQSLTIDAGDPAEGVGAEPAPNGGLANQGSYGLTAQASESVPPPTAVALVGVGLSSATVSFGAVGAAGYVVQASTIGDFSGVLFSSVSATGATVLAPQGLDPDTTYYLRAGSLWGETTVYALTMLSTSTLALPVSGTAVTQVYGTSVAVNWIAFAASPPAPSSMSASGYVLQTSTRPDFTVIWNTSATPNVALSTLSAAGLAGGVTYYFHVGSLNWDGAVDYAAPISFYMPLPHQPQEPFGIALTSAIYGYVYGTYGPALTSATIRWMPVVRYADQTPFAVSTAPTVAELVGYSVYRATTPINAVWTDVADLSTGTLSWTDVLSGPQYYYCVNAWNYRSQANCSVVRTPGALEAYYVAPDNASFYQVAGPQVTLMEGLPGDPNSAYLITVSSRAQDLGSLNGIVVKSIEFDAYQGGALLSPQYALASPGLLSLHYSVSGSSGVAASSFAKGAGAAPSNMSVYWFNGQNWVQQYGKLDPLSQTVTVQTKFFGKYQLRAVERAGGFSFGISGVSNRFITPNGDHRNDNVVFTFDNPNNSAVTGKIFDMRGRVVAGSLPAGPFGTNSLIWDGTSGGRSVPGGVYLYQIQAEGQTYSGTLVIIK